MGDSLEQIDMLEMLNQGFLVNWNILLNVIHFLDMPVMAKPKPSADNVGCEFVRQYYTMLNKDPRQVHRYIN